MIWICLLAVALSLILAIGARASAPPSRAELFAAAASVAASIVASVYLLTSPAYAMQDSVRSADASNNTSPTVLPATSTLIATEGWTVVLPMLVFVGVSAIPFLFWRRPARVYAELGSAAVLGTLSLLSGFSIGRAYVPSAVLTLLAGIAGRTRRPPNQN